MVGDRVVGYGWLPTGRALRFARIEPDTIITWAEREIEQ